MDRMISCSMATPMRTPRVMGANGLDHITMEAQNLARLQAGQTPLAGGANPMIHASDFSGVTPRQSVAATPNPHLGMTPRGGETPSLNGEPNFYAWPVFLEFWISFKNWRLETYHQENVSPKHLTRNFTDTSKCFVVYGGHNKSLCSETTKQQVWINPVCWAFLFINLTDIIPFLWDLAKAFQCNVHAKVALNAMVYCEELCSSNF